MIILPILFGFGISYYLLQEELSTVGWPCINWTINTLLFIVAIIILAGIRDLAYMYRIRILTDKAISWKNSFNVIMLWEFASAVTPSVVGGSSVAFYILYKEGIPAGKSTAMVMITALLDELFLIIFAPLFISSVGHFEVFELNSNLTFGNWQLAKKKFLIWGGPPPPHFFTGFWHPTDTPLNFTL